MELNGKAVDGLEGDTLDDEVVIVKHEEASNHADLSISCSDATGLGCDIARVLFNFGLTVARGDFSTDGRWCFVMLRVQPCETSPPCAANWSLLKEHLLRTCNLTASSLEKKRRTGEKFLLQLGFQDRIGRLHDIVHELWELGLVVHKANISTSPENKGLNLFYISDTTDRLPSSARVDEIHARLSERLQDPEAHIACLPLPKFPGIDRSSRLLTGSRACRDSRSSIPLRSLFKRGEGGGGNNSPAGSRRSSVGSVVSENSFTMGLDMLSSHAEIGRLTKLKVSADNLVSPTHTVLHIECNDRKGLMYDLFRITKDMGLQICYGKIDVDDVEQVCKSDLFVHEIEFGQKLDDEMIEYSCMEIKNAITNSIKVRVENKVQDMEEEKPILQTEVVALAPVDSGFRGRPRVLYDLTATLHELDLSIFHAEMYTVEGQLEEGATKRYQEVHRFIVQDKHGRHFSKFEDLNNIRSTLYRRLLGHDMSIETSDKIARFSILKQFITNGILD